MRGRGYGACSGTTESPARTPREASETAENGGRGCGARRSTTERPGKVERHQRGGRLQARERRERREWRAQVGIVTVARPPTHPPACLPTASALDTHQGTFCMRARCPRPGEDLLLGRFSVGR